MQPIGSGVPPWNLVYCWAIMAYVSVSYVPDGSFPAGSSGERHTE